MSTWQTIYGGSVDGDPVRAHPAPFDTESNQASTTATNIEYVSDEFSKIRFGDSDGFRGETAQALGRKVAGWQAKLDPTASVFRDLSKIMSSHSDQLTALRSQAELSAGKALAVWKLKVAAQETVETTAQSIPGASGDVSTARTKLAWIHAQIAALTPGTPDTAILLPKYQNEQTTWAHELSANTARLNSLNSTLKSAQGDVNNYQDQLNDWHYGGRNDSWQSLRRREDDLNGSTAQSIKNIDLGSLANPGYLAQKEADFASFIRDTVAAIDKAISAAIKTLIAAIKIVLIVVAVIVLAIIAIAIIVAAIYLVVLALAYIVAALVVVAEVLVEVVVRILASTLLRSLVVGLIRANNVLNDSAKALGWFRRNILGETPPVHVVPPPGSQSGRVEAMIKNDPGGVGTYNQAAIYRFLADDTGNNRNGPNETHFTGPDGQVWTRLSLSDLQAKGIDPGLLNTRTGLQATVYENANHEIVVAYKGSEPFNNWTLKGAPSKVVQLYDDWVVGDGVDATVGSWESPFESQQRQAVELSGLVTAAYGTGNVVFTGHSLGGDLAASSAMETGSAAVTFNAKGVNHADLIADGWSENQIDQVGPTRILAYQTSNDPLSAIQQATPAANALGTNVVVPSTTPATDFVAGHALKSFPATLSAPAKVLNPSASVGSAW